MNRKTIITIILLIVGLGISLALDQPNPDTIPGSIHNVQWIGERPDNAEIIEKLLFQEIIPYKTEYERVNISSSDEAGIMHIKVISTAIDSDSPDIYEFVYENDELKLTGYLLEAISLMNRNEAIGIAINDQDLAASVRNLGAPSVKRILPKTSEKFYTPKTLFSVTWKGVSALVDPDERKVVQVWKEAASNIKQ